MGLSAVTYALAKKYTDNTVIGMGGLKGAPCKIKSIVKDNDVNVITFEWKDDLGNTHESVLEVENGTPIYTWRPNVGYKYGDLIIYESNFYRCTIPNSDSSFNEDHWAAINSPDGAYGLVTLQSQLPIKYTAADRKIYYVRETGLFYYWNGSEWEPQKISDKEIDELFI
jgi:hypothetical protein